MQGAELLVKMLEAHDVRNIFGLPGDTSMAFYDALKDSRSIRHIMGRDERSCGYMADAYARLSGRPGVTEAPSGGGAAYLYPAVLEADGSSIPLVALTSDVPLSSENRGALTAMDQVAAYRTATRFTSRLTRPEFIPHSVRTAFRAATGGRMGAAHLAFPEDVLSGAVEADDDLYASPECSRFPAWRTRPDAQRLEEAAELLLHADRPLILTGGGVILSGAMEALQALAEQLGIGVVTTMDGKGSIRETHPLALGVIGSNGGKAASNRTLSESDVVLAIGSNLNSTSTWGWSLLKDASVIHVDVDPNQLDNNIACEVTIQADAQLFLADLAEATRSVDNNGSRWHQWVQTAREDVQAETDSICKIRSDQPGVLHPAEVITALRGVLPDDAVIIADAGTPTPYLAAYYPTKVAGKSVYAARAHGSLGYALPAALGASVARPGSPIIAVTGDGSLGMSIGELETLMREGEGITILHLRNETFGWIKMLQRLYYSERYFSVDFDPRANYTDAARGLGASATKVTTPHSLAEALTASLEENLSFIEVDVPAEIEATPPVAAWERDIEIPAEQRSRRSY